MAEIPRSDRRGRWILFAIVLIGLALRIAAGRGGLWLDEAWSELHAAGVKTPIGVFLGINHDNNHHINSLWMQALGVDAPPLLVRGLSIVTGTFSILVAAAIGARRSPRQGLIVAALFAISPMLVSLGSEARGYAPMLLALLIAIRLADRWLDDPTTRNPATSLALCFFLGGLCQLTIVFGFIAIAGWVGFTLWRRLGLAPAMAAAARLMLPSFVAILLVAALVFVPAMYSPHGFAFGRYDPFELHLFLHGIAELIGFTVGVPVASLAWLPVALALLVLGQRLLVHRPAFYWLAMLLFPLALALLRAGNPGHARYYLLVGVALLLLLGELIDAALGGRPLVRWIGAVALGAMLVAGVLTDLRLATNLRGDVSLAITALKTREPAGTGVTAVMEADVPVLQVAAAEAGYPLGIAECAPYLFLEAARHEATPASVSRCGRQYRPIAGRDSFGPSGLHWTLYEARP